MTPDPRPIGSGVSDESSFFQRLMRLALNPQICVEPERRAVASHFVHDHAVGLAFPTARHHVDLMGIEEHPDLRPFRGSFAWLWIGLDEIRHRRDYAVHRFVEPTVNTQSPG